MRLNSVIIFLVLLWQIQARAQNSNWQLTVSTGSVVSKVTLQELKEDTLWYLAAHGRQFAPVDSINELRLVKEISFWDGAEPGAIIGSSLGVLYTLFFFEPGYSFIPPLTKLLAILFNGIWFAIEGGLIGGAVASIAGTDEVHDLSRFPLEGKLTLIGAILDREKRE